MSDELALLNDTLRAIFDAHCTREARADDRASGTLWTVLESSGMTTLGADAGIEELIVLSQAAGRAAAPIPVVEAAGLASWLAAAAGLVLPAGMCTAAAAHPRDELHLTRTAHGWLVQGTLHRVPWGSTAACTVAQAPTQDGPVVVVLRQYTSASPGRNLAGEPRDTLHYQELPLPVDAVAAVSLDADALLMRGALLRSAAMAGAMERVLELSLDHAQGREQFGRAISGFQAVEAHLVAIAEQTLCTGMAVRAASLSERAAREKFSVAAAKLTASSAADVVTARAHQVHGAVGTTAEHSLHWYTTRLWAWQDEFGTAQYWATQLGGAVVADGAAQLWPNISSGRGGRRSAPTRST